MHATARPILVGTLSVAESEELASALLAAGIPPDQVAKELPFLGALVKKPEDLEVVEQGSHEELMDMDGRYAHLFSLQAAARAYQILDLDDPELRAWLKRRARWIVRHDEWGRLTNHHALAALGLLRVGQITGEAEFRALEQRVTSAAQVSRRPRKPPRSKAVLDTREG